MLKIKDVSFSYGKDKVLNNISLELYSGEILCLAGPNGSGKTTLIQNILGILTPEFGSIYIGKDINNKELNLKKILYIY